MIKFVNSRGKKRKNDAPDEVMISRVQELYTSSHLSDLKLKVGDHEFKVHKFMLCLHSDYFKHLFTGGWAKTVDDVFELEEEDPVIIVALINFIYSFKYEISEEIDKIALIDFNTKLYQVADKYLVLKLKEVTSKRVNEIAKECWESEDFPVSIAEAYERTSPTETLLRGVFVNISYDHIDALMESENFRAVVQGTVGFAADLVRVLYQENADQKLEGYKIHCSFCSKKSTYVVDEEDRTLGYEP
ncbi:hypothetical protein N7456_003096 [Penicillium angulare]|uniref:BTB domain-containing protein n=1 Tax=Penicillium angulare TaxID=116970 RepID=A0A9W9FTZ4_9EURO|nr:hypothetical protein N7456_003096 [Penicillium angulare]